MIEAQNCGPLQSLRPADRDTFVGATLDVPREVLGKFDVETNHRERIEDTLLKKISATELENEEAFYIIDLGVILKKYKQWITHLPRVKPFYAIKCNPNTAIIKTLATLGVNFDCASKAEIQQILGSGVAASRIIYANPTKMKSHMQYAKSAGVEMMTFDNADELKKIAECYPDAKLLLRIITDDSHSICRFSTKFGAPLNQTRPLLQLAKSLGLNVIGVSFHVGSGCMSAASFTSALTSARGVFNVAKEIGFNMNVLDLGGGWPGTDEDGVCFADVAACVRATLDALFPADIQVIAEPGRYFVAESHTLAVNVFAKRREQREGDEPHFLYYVNDGVYQSFNCIFFDHAHPQPLVLVPNGRTEMHRCTIFGPTCDSMDCVAKDILMPELEVGEWLYFKAMGAYTVAAASPFNGFKSSPTTYYVQSPLDYLL